MRRSSALKLAFSHLHEWLLPPTSKGNLSHDGFRSLCENAGVGKLGFLRHGKTAPKPQNGVDFDRLLTDEGRGQAREAGGSFGTMLTPFYPLMLVSPAPRTMETANLFLNAASSSSQCRIKPVQSFYDGTMQPKGSALFQKIGYAPLQDYVDSDDPEDRDLSQTLLGMYANMVLDAIVETLQDSSDSGVDDNSTLWMVGHAIYLPAAALGVAAMADCNEKGIQTILSMNTKEAEGYLIDVKKQEASYLSRETSAGQ